MSRSPPFKLDLLFGDVHERYLAPPPFMDFGAADFADDDRGLTPDNSSDDDDCDIWKKFELPTPPRSPGSPDRPECGGGGDDDVVDGNDSWPVLVASILDPILPGHPVLDALDWTSAALEGDDTDSGFKDFLEDVDLDDVDSDLSDVLNSFLFDDEQQTEEDVDDVVIDVDDDITDEDHRTSIDVLLSPTDDAWCGSGDRTTMFRSELLHDCMWSGQCNEEHRRALMESPSTIMMAVAESVTTDIAGVTTCCGRLSRADSRCSVDSTTSTSTSCSSTSSSSSSSTSPCIPVMEHPLSPLPLLLTPCGTPPYDCGSSSSMIDSKTILAYPFSDHTYYLAAGHPTMTVTLGPQVKQEPQAPSILRPVLPVAPSSPAVVDQNLGIQTPSDSEEEIDVVTVGDKTLHHHRHQQQQHQQRQSKATRRQQQKQPEVDNIVSSKTGNVGRGRRRRRSLPSHPSPQVQRQLQLAVAVATQQQQKGSATSTPTCNQNQRDTKRAAANETHCDSPHKRARNADDAYERHHHHHHHHRTVIKTEPSSPSKKSISGAAAAAIVNQWSRPSSDSEDVEKRKEHNDLERKRRNDLKSSFQMLRKQVPDLQNNDRAPKVLILRKAAEHIRQLTSTFGHLDRVQRMEGVKNAELQRKLQQLQRRR